MDPTRWPERQKAEYLKIHLRLPKALHERVMRHATHNYQSFNAAVVELLNKAVL